MNTLLLTLHNIAVKLRWCRSVAGIVALLGVGGVFVSLFLAAGNYGHLLEPSLVVTLWGMMLFAFVQLFQQIPPPVLPQDDFITRVGSRLILALYSLLALLVVLVTLVLLWMSYRLIYLE